MDSKKKIEYEVEIDIKLKENVYSNNITIIPVDKYSYISDFNYIEIFYFDFIYKEPDVGNT